LIKVLKWLGTAFTVMVKVMTGITNVVEGAFWCSVLILVAVFSYYEGSVLLALSAALLLLAWGAHVVWRVHSMRRKTISPARDEISN
jgi:hypothetical protein